MATFAIFEISQLFAHGLRTAFAAIAPVRALFSPMHTVTAVV